MMNQIEHVVLDFDGTCTQIPVIYEEYAAEYRRGFCATVAAVTPEEWHEAENIVRAHSPGEGWSVGGTPSAPVAADPYILSDEVSKLLCRRRNLTPPTTSGLHGEAYRKLQAPWREEARRVFCELARRGVHIHFVSNSGSAYIRGRLDDLLSGEPAVRQAISVQSDAGKFFIRELSWGGEQIVNDAQRARFDALPVSDDPRGVPFARPIYLRRGSYYEALCRTLGNDPSVFERTLVCGDVWELDLALPFHLGMRVHLIERAAPFDTYEYEHTRLEGCGERGSRSESLAGLLDILA